MSKKFIVVTTIGTNTRALLRASAIVSVIQDQEYPERRTIEYVAGDKLQVVRVLDSADDILQKLQSE